MENKDVKLGRKAHMFFFETWMQLFVVPILINIVVAYSFCEIESGVDYTWYAGLWHGLCVIGNLVLLLFDSSRLVIAHHLSVAYYVFLAIGALASVCVVIFLKELCVGIKKIFIHQASCE